MALYKLILAYDGTDFSGFQRQGKTRTVQLVVETVLRELGWQQPAMLFAGRTDAGVHACGQVATISLDWQHSSADLVNALNARLPDDVSVIEANVAQAEFHPRYDASSRTYHYHLYQLPVRQPLLERYAWRIWPELDPERLDRAASRFIGRHDFCAFGRAMKKGGSTTREVYTSQWMTTPEGWRYEDEANAFHSHMVRRMVFIQVQAASGADESEIETALREGRPLKPGLAPAQGLFLVNVSYAGLTRERCEDEKN